MKNKSSYYKILNLTAEEGWLNHPEIIKNVQELGGTIPYGRAIPYELPRGKWYKSN